MGMIPNVLGDSIAAPREDHASSALRILTLVHYSSRQSELFKRTNPIPGSDARRTSRWCLQAMAGNPQTIDPGQCQETDYPFRVILVVI